VDGELHAAEIQLEADQFLQVLLHVNSGDRVRHVSARTAFMSNLPCMPTLHPVLLKRSPHSKSGMVWKTRRKLQLYFTFESLA
jgi:hypothetical protein